ncbi:MAG: ABC transporter ATP-binding protein [Actinobacteria bacterium]|jgi:thiamine transport system ATP-binding protein|nr:ABC transporter ATP-binding protein [Actinomycetota bacterium]MCB9427516.1 ABC transporter ATP-binding protein [Actinomycetota bacterium]
MLSMTAVEVSYDEPVLHGIDLEVGPGEIVCILGPSGGGKSTLLRAVAGLVDHTGSIAVAGRSLAGVPAHRRGVGMMFQDDLLFPHLDVASNVGFGLSRQDPQRVAQMLELVGLAGYEHRAVDTLSGGQAQRVALARALAPEPDVLLLDEPFGALDVVLKAQLVLEVQQVLRDRGVTVLAVTHDRHEAFTMADRVAVLRAGELVQVATADELWNKPVDAYVARLVGLSVLDGVAYPPEELRITAQGRWALQVTGRTFLDGRYLVSGVVDGESVTFGSDARSLPAVGQTVHIDRVDPAG